MSLPMAEIAQSELKHFPHRDLQSCLLYGKRLADNLGDTGAKTTVAASVIGYGTVNGAALTALAALKHYGLIERARGRAVKVTPLLRQVLVDRDPETLIDLAFRPALFSHLRDTGYATATDAVVIAHLREKGLTQTAARDAVNVFRLNLALGGHNPPTKPPPVEPPPRVPPSKAPDQALQAGHRAPLPRRPLASYTIPLFNCDATLNFVGTDLDAKDWARLIEHMGLCAKTAEGKTA